MKKLILFTAFLSLTFFLSLINVSTESNSKPVCKFKEQKMQYNLKLSKTASANMKYQAAAIF